LDWKILSGASRWRIAKCRLYIFGMFIINRRDFSREVEDAYV